MTNSLAEVAKAAGLTVSQSSVQGIEGMDDRELKLGTIVLVQSMTKVFIKKGFKEGDFVNTVTEKKVEDTTFIPAYMRKVFEVRSYADKSKPNGDFLFITDSENDPRLAGKSWKQEGEKKAEIVPTIKVVAIVAGQPVFINFKKSSGYSAGQKLYSYAKDSARNAQLPLWGVKYKLLSKEAKNKAGIEYAAMDVERVGETTQEERDFAYSLFVGLSAKKDAIADPSSDAAEVVTEEVPF